MTKKIKILQITTDNREYHKDYLSPEPCFGAAPQALLEGFSSMSDIEVHVLSCIRQPVSSPEYIYGNIHFHSLVVPKAGWMSSLYIGCIKRTRELIRKINPDIVHGQGTERDCAMNAVYSGYPNVLTIHGNMAELSRLGVTFQSAKMYGFLASHLESHALSKTHGVFCNSRYTEGLVSPRAKKTWIVPNAIRAEFFREECPNSPPNKQPLILNIGQLGRRKQQLEILMMAGKLHKIGLQFHLVFLGGVHENDDYAKAFLNELKNAEKLGYASHYGFMNADEMIALMDRASGFIHYPLEEAFGLVVAEAMARGLRVFCGNIGGIKDICSEVKGIKLHDSLGSLQVDIAEWLKSGAPRHLEAKQKIINQYHPQVVAQRHLDIYQEVLKV